MASGPIHKSCQLIPQGLNMPRPGLPSAYKGKEFKTLLQKHLTVETDGSWTLNAQMVKERFDRCSVVNHSLTGNYPLLNVSQTTLKRSPTFTVHSSCVTRPVNERFVRESGFGDERFTTVLTSATILLSVRRTLDGR